jgi:hypothetical protein
VPPTAGESEGGRTDPGYSQEDTVVDLTSTHTNKVEEFVDHE